MVINTEEATVTVVIAKVNGKQLTLSKIKTLPILDLQNCWLDEYMLGTVSVIGKIPPDIALTVCQKRGKYRIHPANYDFYYNYGLIIHLNNELYLTLVPSEDDDFYRLHLEYSIIKDKLKRHWGSKHKVKLPRRANTRRSNDSKVNTDVVIEIDVEELETQSKELITKMNVIREALDETKYLFI